MNVRMSRVFRIPALLVSERYPGVMTTVYDCVIDMTSASESSHEINIAYERIKHWFYEIMRNSVLISQDHPDLRAWQAVPVRCLILPEDPVDQIVGIVLWRKLTAIVQDRLEINHVSISSPLDDDVIYHHDAEDAQGPVGHDGWWSDPRPIWEAPRSRGRSRDKVISLDRPAEWTHHDLGWENDLETETQAVVTDFTRDADQ